MLLIVKPVASNGRGKNFVEETCNNGTGPPWKRTQLERPFFSVSRCGFQGGSNGQRGSLISGLFSFYLIAGEDRISYVRPRVELSIWILASAGGRPTKKEYAEGERPREQRVGAERGEDG